MDFTTHQLYALFAIAASVLLATLIAYRIGMSTRREADANALVAAQLANNDLSKANRELQAALRIEQDDAEQLKTQLTAAQRKQEHHQAQLLALHEDALRAEARHALTAEDATCLALAAHQLDVAAKTYRRLNANIPADQNAASARQLLNIAARAPQAPGSQQEHAA